MTMMINDLGFGFKTRSHGVVKNDIQNKINHLLRSGKRRRDTRYYDDIPPVHIISKSSPEDSDEGSVAGDGP